MSAKQEKNLILMGLPQSGKTTFISALWHLVESREIASSLEIISIPDERAYLNHLRSTWLDCQSVERTKTNSQFPIHLAIKDTRTNDTYQLIFPDVSGEMYAMQFEARIIDKAYLEQLKLCKGILLFVNPKLVRKPVLISDADAFIETTSPSPTQQPTPWSHKDAPTQVVLVDLLQILGDFAAVPLKIALVVSAWDLVKNAPDQAYQMMKPEEYIQQEMPLLGQYLDTNASRLSVKVFGISAQGATYGKESPRLQNMFKQSERIIVQDGNNLNHDLCLPLKWLINEK